MGLPKSFSNHQTLMFLIGKWKIMLHKKVCGEVILTNIFKAFDTLNQDLTVKLHT